LLRLLLPLNCEIRTGSAKRAELAETDPTAISHPESSSSSSIGRSDGRCVQRAGT